MTDKELTELYRLACRAKGFEPNDGQFKVWKQTLNWSDYADLSAAITWWYQTETTFPMPAELKPLIWRASREREARASVKQYLVVWVCPVCNYRMSGFLGMEQRGARRCPSKWGPTLPPDAPRTDGKRPERIQLRGDQRCGADLIIVSDDRLATA